ncbi:MAG: hypothetical protein E6K58_03245 [Nitrospirae bacterium]|nr:MAG: hypothetical protein AUH21_02580 [Nitrospirae bacterium 13_2_20CM_62_7]TLY44274.1 MAG: hypothetical protein E6K58_03245 [Nitrospirota bacterium]
MAAVFSSVVPGSGQALRGRIPQAAIAFLISAALLGCTWLIERAHGGGAAVLFLMLLVLPWWAIQSYDAWLTAQSSEAGLGQTLKVIWVRAHDVRYLGALFLLTALTDLYIIVANPGYSLTVFCTKPAGLLGALAKAQSPTLHTLIGYGFLRLRRWSLLLYLAYAAFGLLNGTANYACFGYGRVRTVFLVTLIAFTAYVFWRRRCFTAPRAGYPGL